MSKWITPDVRSDAPPPRNLTKELDAIYGAKYKYAGKDAALEEQYGPRYNRVSIGNLGESVLGYTDAQGNHVPGSAELTRGTNSAQRAADIADVARLGPAEREAYFAANPELRQAFEQLTGRLTDSKLLTTLNQQAEAGLTTGGRLTPAEERQASQDAIQGYSDRNMLGGGASVAAEILGRDAARRARLREAQNLAANVQGLNTTQSGVVNAATNTIANASPDPFLAITGHPSNNPGQNYQPTYGPMNLSQYAQDLFNTNYNAGINLAIQNSNAQANTRSSIAQIGSSFSDRRLKENIVPVGKSPSGLEIVEFTWRDIAAVAPHLRGKRCRGVIADDVQKLYPAAVWRGTSDGFLRVRYDLIDVRLVDLGTRNSDLGTERQAA